MSKDRLDEHLQNIQSALGGSGEPTSNDKLDWYLSNITSLIEGGGGGGGGSGISDVKINNTSVVSDHVANISLKTINNNSIVGSGDLSIASKHTFPNTWTTNNTTETFCTSIVNDDSAVPGMIYMGKLTCSDLPAGLGQGEASVEIISKDANGKALRIILTSVDTAPYRWEYERAKVNGTYKNTGWVSYLPTAGGIMSGDIKLPYTSKLVCNDGSTMMYGENDGSGIHIGNGTKNAATVTLIVGADESAKVQKGSSFAATKYNILDAYNTSANPTLAGTETTLTGLKLNGTNYAIGAHLYQHNLTIKTSNTSHKIFACTNILSNSATAMQFTDLETLVATDMKVPLTGGLLVNSEGTVLDIQFLYLKRESAGYANWWNYYYQHYDAQFTDFLSDYQRVTGTNSTNTNVIDNVIQII